ncbi:MAG: penicillin-binding protein activator LpoB [Verrucomicrobia bacterium]|nr:MAG: penicillin-binding protein activator LpoB [Verrucomicrobiota bacterium]
MKTSPLVPLVATAGALLLAGCASTQTTYVPQGSSRLVTSVGKVNIQDFEQAADDMVKSLTDNLISPGKLQSSVPSEPSLMAISRIVNSTGQQLETDLLTKKIRVALNRTGLVQTSTTIGIGGAEDPIAADQQKAQEFFEDKKHTRLPDYTLSGKIIEVKDKAGNIHQSSYVFQLSLTSNKGVAVWEEEKTITKQGSRATVGF